MVRSDCSAAAEFLSARPVLYTPLKVWLTCRTARLLLPPTQTTPILIGGQTSSMTRVHEKQGCRLYGRGKSGTFLVDAPCKREHVRGQSQESEDGHQVLPAVRPTGEGCPHLQRRSQPSYSWLTVPVIPAGGWGLLDERCYYISGNNEADSRYSVLLSAW